MPFNTLLDISKANHSDREVGLVEEVMIVTPEIQYAAARTIPGYEFKCFVRTGLPDVGFRWANEGSDPVASTFAERDVKCFIMNPPWQCDKAVADAYVDGPEAFIAMEALGMVKGSFATLGKQFYYGNAGTGHAKGHPGLIQAHDAANMVVDAGGTTVDTGSSVWAVSFGVDKVTWVYGNNGEFAVSDPVVQQITKEGKILDAYCQSLLVRPGLQVANINAVARIKKLTEDSGKGLDDDKLADLFHKFPPGITPDAIFMTRRSRRQLQQSRTATNATGAPAPIPIDYEGVPIRITDSISNTESLTL